MKTISLNQVARSTEQKVTSLVEICKQLGIPVKDESIEVSMEPYVTTVAEMLKAKNSLEEAIAYVKPSVPKSPSSAPNSTPPSQPNNTQQYEPVDPDEVRMVLQQRVGGVLGRIQGQGNALLAQVDQKVVESAQEFNQQLNDRVNLFWLAVATDDGGKLPGEESPIVDLTIPTTFTPAITGQFDRRMLAAPKSQNLLAG